MYYFTADEHYGHANIIDYCSRPFVSIEEMDEELIRRHNIKINNNNENTIIHAGDFTLSNNKNYIDNIIKRLNGNHIFLKGSHDYWLKKDYQYIWERKIGQDYIVVCHYAMRTWARSHYNTWQLYGHSHGKLKPEGKQWDIGVDNNDFYPLALWEIRHIMNERPDNFNFIKK